MTADRDFEWAGWFDRMAACLSADPELRKSFGFADFRFLVEIESENEGRIESESEGDPAVRRFGILLDGYDVLSAGEVADPDAFAADATLAGPLSAWQEMADNIEQHGRADGAHTLNALSIADYPLRLLGQDPLGRDKFFRYAATLQALFDAPGRSPSSVG